MFWHHHTAGLSGTIYLIGIPLPQKGYANITIKNSTYQRFLFEAERARWSDPAIDNSRFLDLLLGSKEVLPQHAKQRAVTRHGGEAEIKKVASRLGVRELVPEVIRIYEQARSHGPGQRRDHLVGSALYIACKNAGIPKTLGQIAETAGLDRNMLFSHATTVAMKMGLSISGTNATSFVRNIADRVNSAGFKYKVSEKSIRDALALLEKLKDEPVVEGRSPKTMASWALYRSCKRNRDNISQKSIASAAEIVEANLSKVTEALESRKDM